MVTTKDIRELMHHVPFQTFKLHLADGKSLLVPHLDFIFTGGNLVVVAEELPDGSPGELNFFPYEHIVRIEMLPRKTRKAA